MKKNKVFSIILSVTLLSSGQSFCAPSSYSGRDFVAYYMNKVSPKWMTNFISKYLPSRQHKMVGALSLTVLAGLTYYYGYPYYKKYTAGSQEPETKAETQQPEGKEPEEPQIMHVDLAKELADLQEKFTRKIGEYNLQGLKLYQPVSMFFDQNNKVNLSRIIAFFNTNALRKEREAQFNTDYPKLAQSAFQDFIVPIFCFNSSMFGEKNEESCKLTRRDAKVFPGANTWLGFMNNVSEAAEVNSNLIAGSIIGSIPPSRVVSYETYLATTYFLFTGKVADQAMLNDFMKAKDAYSDVEIKKCFDAYVAAEKKFTEDVKASPLLKGCPQLKNK